jgi:hypothetical protein
VTTRYRYQVEWFPPGGISWERHPWTSQTDKRPDANHGMRMLEVNRAPLEAMGLWGPLRVTRVPLDTP